MPSTYIDIKKIFEELYLTIVNEIDLMNLLKNMFYIFGLSGKLRRPVLGHRIFLINDSK